LLLEKLSKPCFINQLVNETEVVQEKEENCHRRVKANITGFISVKNPTSAEEEKRRNDNA